MSDNLKLPTFIILGAQKAGTTSLHHALKEHRDIYMSEPKELSFFNIDSNYQRGSMWYSSFFKHWNSERIAGECTPSYLWDEKVPGRIKTLLPDARFIILLRNPVDRAYSAYWYAVANCDEVLSFEEALEAEPDRKRLSPEVRGFSSYIDRGLYSRQVKRYLEKYDRSQVLIIIREDYKNNQRALLSKVTRFLEVNCDHEFILKAQHITRNVTMIPRFKKVHGHIPFLMRRFPLAGRVLRKLNLKRDAYPPLSTVIRRKLSERFRESNSELEMILGRRLDVWEH
jgi:hypothetical protein